MYTNRTHIWRAGAVLGATLVAVVAIAATLAALGTAALGAAAPGTATDLIWKDHFNSTTLDARWSWIREDNTHWSLGARPGFLRITTQTVFQPVKNILVTRAPVGNFEIETRLFFTPTLDFQFAGLLVYQDDANFIGLGRAYCDVPVLCVGNGIYFDHVENGSYTGVNFGTVLTTTSEAYLKITREGNVYTGFASVDGNNWIELGTKTATMTPDKVGLVASNQFPDVAEINADFDYFELKDESFHVLLPVVIK